MRLSLFQGIVPVKKSQFPADVIAGVTLAALAIPIAMGYTKIAGTPMITGLYTMLAPMLLFAVFGSSRHLVVSADSATAAILAAGLAGSVAPESPAWLAEASLLAILSAGFLILARVARLGFLADFLSRTVMTGFLTGVGIQVAMSQLSEMLGLPKGGSNTIHHILNIAGNIQHLNLCTAAVTAAVLAVIIGGRKISKTIPGPLIALGASILAGRLLHLDSQGVHLLGAIPGGLPRLGLPDIDWSWSLAGRLLPTAFAMFIVILAQSAATSRAFAAIHNEGFDENTDLVGLALANLGAGLSGAFVVNGSPTQTQVVENAGGKSQVAQLTACLIVLLVLLFLTGPLAWLPEAALASVIFLTGIKLVNIDELRRIRAARPSEFWIAFITALVVVFIGVEEGIILAIFLSLIEHTRQGYRPHNTIIVLDGAHALKSRPVDRPAQIVPGLLIYRFSHSLYYANKELFLSQAVDLVRGAQPPLSWFCVDAAAIDDVDFEAATALISLQKRLKNSGIRLVFTQVSGEVLSSLEAYGLSKLVGHEAFYATIAGLLKAYRQTSPEAGRQ